MSVRAGKPESQPLVRASLRGGIAHLRNVRKPLLFAWAWNLSIAVCLGAIVNDAVVRSLGSSLAGARMRQGWDSLWSYSFSAQATGVAATLRPTVSGIGAILDSLDSLLDGFVTTLLGGPAAVLLPVVLLYLFSVAFLNGGFVATFAGRRGGGFLQRAGWAFPRVFTLALLGLAGYWLVLGPLRGTLDDVVARLLRESTDERWQFAATAAEYAFLWSLILLLNVVLDYAKILAVRNQDASWLGAAAGGAFRGARFVWRHPRRAGGLYLLIGLLWLALLAVYAAVVPGAAHGSAFAVIATFALGQAYLIGRMAIRCLCYASETVLCGLLEPRSSL